MELIINITTFLPHPSLNALTKTTKHFHESLMKTLYDTCPNPQSKLIWACEKNNIILAKEMMSRGAITWFIQRGPLQATSMPLAMACIKGHVEMVKFLIEVDPGLVNLVDFIKWSPLWYAVKHRRVDIVKILLQVPELEDGLLVSRSGNLTFEGFTRIGPVNIALKKGDMSMLNVLLEDRRVALDKGSLLAAAMGGNLDCVRFCLERGYLQDSVKDGLVHACKKGYEEMVVLLLDHAKGLDRSQVKELGEGTALVMAAMQGHEGVARILLSRLDLNLSSHISLAFARASMFGHIGIMKLLLATDKVDINWQGDGGLTPVAYATGSGKENALRFLLSLEGIKPSLRDDRGMSPLYSAATSGVPGVVKALLDSGSVDPEVRESATGRTPLMVAVQQGVFLHQARDCYRRKPNRTLGVAEQDILNLLKDVNAPVSSDWMKHGERREKGQLRKETRDTLGVMRHLLASNSVNPSTRSNTGEMALFDAIVRRQVDAVQLLLLSGRVDLSLVGRDGRTALEYAEHEYKRLLDGEWDDLEPVSL